MTSPETPAEPRHAGRRTLGHAVVKGFTDAGAYVVLIAASILTLGPLLLSLNTALKEPSDFSSNGPFTPPLPPTLDNFWALLTGQVSVAGTTFVAAVYTTIAVVVLVTVGQLVFSIMAAFAFAKIPFIGRDGLFWVFLATLMVPQIVTIVPLFMMFAAANLQGTFAALVLPYLFGSPYAIFLLREYFRGVPDDLIDAARIDGAGAWRILWSIIVPVSRPIIVTLLLITIVTHWNNFLWPLVVAGNTNPVITVATSGLQTANKDNWTLVMAATTIAILPLIILFVIFQRQIVRSITITGFK